MNNIKAFIVSILFIGVTSFIFFGVDKYIDWAYNKDKCKTLCEYNSYKYLDNDNSQCRCENDLTIKIIKLGKK